MGIRKQKNTESKMLQKPFEIKMPFEAHRNSLDAGECLKSPGDVEVMHADIPVNSTADKTQKEPEHNNEETEHFVPF